MLSERREREIDSLFNRIVELAPEEREKALAAARRERPEVVAGVEELLAGEEIVSCLRIPLPPPEVFDPPPGPEVMPPCDFDKEYEILKELGRGGMGIVYLARQVSLNRRVALKMILAGTHAGEDERQRFRDEAEAVARLQHPNIVQVYEVGEADGHPFFSLEFCPGGSLAAKLSGTPLPPKEAAALVEQLARAVHHAHQRGIVHRDLKPANVLLAEDGTPKITDFGLAKRVEEGSGLTASGVIRGTPSYMAPEQAGGCGKRVGPAADVYALGAILYECLTGRPPFRAATMLDTLEQVRSQEAVKPRSLDAKVPRDLEVICLKCLHKEPHLRYTSALELAEDLNRYLKEIPILARPVGPLKKAWLWCRRKPAQAMLVAAVLGLVAISFVGGVWLWLQNSAAVAHQQETERVVNLALGKADQSVQRVDRLPCTTDVEATAVLAEWREAEAALSEAETALTAGAAQEAVRRRVADARERVEQGRTKAQRKQRLFLDLSQARMARLVVVENKFDNAGAAAKYAAAFAAYGVEVGPGRTAELARQIGAEPPGVRAALIRLSARIPTRVRGSRWHKPLIA
jgi:serine/threonine protein kinase